MNNINSTNKFSNDNLIDFFEQQSDGNCYQIKIENEPLIIKDLPKEYPATMQTLIDLIEKSELTDECIEALRNTDEMQGLVVQYEVLYQNELNKNKMVLSALCEEIFSNSSHFLPQIISLFAWSHLYNLGYFPEGQEEALLSFLGYNNLFDLIKTAEGSSRPEQQNCGSYYDFEEFAQFELNGIVKEYLKMPKELKVLIDEVIRPIETTFKEDTTWGCSKLIYNFFEKKLNKEQCESLVDYMKQNDGWLGRRPYYLILYLRILQSQQLNDKLPPMPDLNSIKNESARILIENIELEVRKEKLNLPSFIQEITTSKKRKEIEGENSIQKISKKPRVPYPADVSTLVKWLQRNNCVPECIKKMRKIHDMKDFIETIEFSLEGDYDLENKLLHAICQEVFENSENKDLLSEVISYFAWNSLYENGHLPSKEGDPLLDFLGYSHPFELITTSPKTRDAKNFEKYQQKRKSSFCDLEEFSTFVCFEGQTIKPVTLDQENVFLDIVLSQTDNEHLEDDIITPLEEMLYSFFEGKVEMYKCRALLDYITLSGGWLLERPYFFAQYLKILTYQKKNGVLPEMPDLNSIKNENAKILIKNIELSARCKDLELPVFSDNQIDHNEIENKKQNMWKIFKNDELDFEEKVINFGTSQPSGTSLNTFSNGIISQNFSSHFAYQNSLGFPYFSIYGNFDHKITRGIRTDLIMMNDVDNGGNSCYISSIVWAMIHAIQEVRGYKAPEKVLKDNEELKGRQIDVSDVQKQFQELVEKISSKETKMIDGITINNFRTSVQATFPESFEQMMNSIVNESPNPGKEQEDPYPILTCLIDECLDIPNLKNKDKSFQIRRNFKEPEVFEDKEKFLYEGSFNRYFDKSDCGSIINIHMGEPSKMPVPLEELVTGERLEVRERNIYEKVQLEKGDKKYRTIDVECRERMIVSSEETAPPYFIGHLARFTYDVQAMKRNDPVSLSEELLFSIFPDEKAEEETGKVAYKILAAVVHKGKSIAFGHYITYCKEGDRWFLYDDLRGISICDPKIALKDIQENGYLFFFEKK